MSERYWGPFNGNHLTAIAGFLVLAIALPGGLWAADAFSNAAIYDPDTGRTATVDGNRRLGVGDGSGPLTVDGAVSAKESPPVDWVRFRREGPTSQTGNETCQKLYAVPLGKALIVRTLLVNFRSPSSSSARIALFAGNSCSEGTRLFSIYSPSGQRMENLQLEPGVIIRPNQSLFVAFTFSFELVGLGYTVPSAAVSAQ